MRLDITRISAGSGGPLFGEKRFPPAPTGIVGHWLSLEKWAPPIFVNSFLPNRHTHTTFISPDGTTTVNTPSPYTPRSKSSSFGAYSGSLRYSHYTPFCLGCSEFSKSASA